MHRRKGSVGGFRYVVKRHRANGQTLTIPLVNVVHHVTADADDAATASSTVLQSTTTDLLAVDQDPPSPVHPPSTYYANKAAQLAEWKRLRSSMLQSAFDREGPSTMCVLCETVCDTIVTCDECGPAYTGRCRALFCNVKGIVWK